MEGERAKEDSKSECFLRNIEITDDHGALSSLQRLFIQDGVTVHFLPPFNSNIYIIILLIYNILLIKTSVCFT